MAGKQLTSEFHPLCVFEFRRRGWLEPGAEFEWYLPIRARRWVDWLAEQLDGKVVRGVAFDDGLQLVMPYTDAQIEVGIEWTECTYGGERPWWVCSYPKCNRRSAKLYWNGKAFVCRCCQELVYDSQYEKPTERLAALARSHTQKVATLGWYFEAARTVDDFPPRPKGMHLTTYERHKAEWKRNRDFLVEMLGCRVAKFRRRIETRFGQRR